MVRRGHFSGRSSPSSLACLGLPSAQFSISAVVASPVPNHALQRTEAGGGLFSVCQVLSSPASVAELESVRPRRTLFNIAAKRLSPHYRSSARCRASRRRFTSDVTCQLTLPDSLASRRSSLCSRRASTVASASPSFVGTTVAAPHPAGCFPSASEPAVGGLLVTQRSQPSRPPSLRGLTTRSSEQRLAVCVFSVVHGLLASPVAELEAVRPLARYADHRLAFGAPSRGSRGVCSPSAARVATPSSAERSLSAGAADSSRRGRPALDCQRLCDHGLRLHSLSEADAHGRDSHAARVAISALTYRAVAWACLRPPTPRRSTYLRPHRQLSINFVVQH